MIFAFAWDVFVVISIRAHVSSTQYPVPSTQYSILSTVSHFISAPRSALRAPPSPSLSLRFTHLGLWTLDFGPEPDPSPTASAAPPRRLLTPDPRLPRPLLPHPH